MTARFEFASDNTSPVCPSAWEALQEANSGATASYGADPWTQRASDLIRERFETDCEVFFTFNGTAANSLALASLCQSYHSVVAHEMAHIETDECGGPEFFSNGTKLLLVPGEQGQVEPAAVERLARRRTDLHFPKTRVLSLTQSTELGTVYPIDKLEEIAEVKERLGLKLHMDGARFANAVASLGVAPREITHDVGVDVLCLGATKIGAAVGDCVVFFDKALAADFAYRCKQAGQLASKMRYLSAAWVGLFEDDVWLANARHANACASRLAEGLSTIAGVELINRVEANAVFVRFPDPMAEGLRQAGWAFYDFIGAGGSRLMCAWDTKPEVVEEFIEAARSLAGQAAVATT